MERVIVVRHHDIDSAGFIADAFEARGADLSVHLFPDDGPLPAFDGADHIVVLGAVSSVNDPGGAGGHRHRAHQPRRMTAAQLAAELEVSVRTVRLEPDERAIP